MKESVRAWALLCVYDTHVYSRTSWESEEAAIAVKCRRGGKSRLIKHEMKYWRETRNLERRVYPQSLTNEESI